jgi:hypothetical protein
VRQLEDQLRLAEKKEQYWDLLKRIRRDVEIWVRVLESVKLATGKEIG